jgi:ferrous iron transport protein A
MLQLSFNRRAADPAAGRNVSSTLRLAEVPAGEQAILDRLELPEDEARRLMELGFLPGQPVVPAMSAPGGDPRVFRVDGSEIALRRETASKLFVHRSAAAASGSM